jgi:sterol desaturase/sphingolipid hydroxylase (fatty acid hydroxylase superfamily)
MRENVRLAAGLSLVFVLLLAVEQVAPLRRRTRPLPRRLIVNAAMSLLSFGTALAIVRPAALGMQQRTSEAQAGIVHFAALPPAAQAVLAFLLMDLTFYWWHVANHRVPFLWRFHTVHHIDPDLDVSTAFRFHFGEVALSAAFRAAQVGLIGPPLWMFLAYEVAFQANTMFHHSNVRLPPRLERLVNRVLVTPRMHGIHHSQVAGETNSNYSVVFSWWDRLHRTFGVDVPQERIVIGVPAYSAPEDNTLPNVLLLPFRRQRDYWRPRDSR